MTRKVSMATRKELIEAVRERYRGAPTVDKTKILDEFIELTGYHRKHAIRLLAGKAPSVRPRAARRRVYDDEFRQSLIVLWEAGDRVCGKRLKALIPLLIEAMEKHGHLRMHSSVKTQLLQVSAATIDRLLSPARASVDGQRRRRTGVGSAFPCARSPTGATLRRASSRSIWSSTVGRRPRATSYTPWC